LKPEFCTEFCTISREGRLTIVTLNRPQAMNALHSAAHFELSQVFDEFAADPDQWVAIITGAGEKAFCAGSDLKAIAKGTTNERPASGFAGLTSRFNLTKPVIAAVNGVAMGGGFEIALACDLVVASDNAVFALPEPRVGLTAFAGGMHRLPRQIGMKHAMGLILTGRRIDAREAQSMGIVNEVVAPSGLMDAARKWAGWILECSPMAVRASKEAAMLGLSEASVEAALSAQAGYPAVEAWKASDDYREGPRAFAEKRKPDWKGR
jgi:enoyl-CoA hydratase/carnithine racemase